MSQQQQQEWRVDRRSAAYAFTIFRYDEAPNFIPDFTGNDVVYAVYQEEIAPTTNLAHVQGYVKYNTRKRFSTVRRAFPQSAHLEAAKGTSLENKRYCTKEITRKPGTEPFEIGVCPDSDGQGRRTDIVYLRDQIKSGRSFTELADNDEALPTLAKHMNFATRLMTANLKPPQRPEITVRICIGHAGCGKSTCAGVFEDNGAYLFDNELKGFWDGYTDQRIVIFDEMKGHTLTPTQFNRVCDKGPYTVNIKNGSAAFRGTDIRITSNFMPSQWWSEKTTYNRQALYRRIGEAHWHRDGEDTQIFHSDELGKYDGCALVKLEQAMFVNGMDL